MEVRLAKRKGRCIQFMDHNGKWKSTGTFDMGEAYVVAHAFLSVNQSEIFRDFAEDMLFSDKPGSWLDTNRKLRKIKESTLEAMRDSAMSYVIPYFGNMKLSEISAPKIQIWYVKMKTKKGVPASRSTRNNALNALSKILSHAEFLGKIERNPCELITKMKPQKTGYPPFTEEEQKKMFPEDEAILESIYDNLNEALFYFVLRDTGMRPAEVAGLSFDNYFPDEHMIFTTESYSRYTKEIEDSVKTTDRGFGNRFGILSPFTEILLRKEIQRLRMIGKSDRIFVYDNGEMKGQTHFYNKLRTICKRTGIIKGNRALYSFRGMFFSRSLSSLPDNVALALMGHTSWHSCYDQRSAEDIVKRMRAIYDSADINSPGEVSTDAVIRELRG